MVDWKGLDKRYPKRRLPPLPHHIERFWSPRLRNCIDVCAAQLCVTPNKVLVWYEEGVLATDAPKFHELIRAEYPFKEREQARRGQ